ncbi:hypothetical protein J4423_00255 [Candidatus Pacearchaeota archaeon]|nr:hypothetical protein [Candidatus Pacearchaeota archaeon]
MSAKKKKNLFSRAYDFTVSKVDSAVEGTRGYFGRRSEAKKKKREEQDAVDEEVEREVQSKLPEAREAMEYAIKKQKGNARKNWVKRRFLPGVVATAVAFGAYEKYAHEPVKNTAEIVLYAADASQRLGRAAQRLGEEIIGRGTEGARFEKAQREFEVADNEYFTGIRELMDTYKQNLSNRKYIVDEMKNAAEGFGKVSRKAPGYEGFRETGIPSMREKLNKWMSEFIGGQSKGDVENRMSKEYADNYNELLKMLNEADRAKQIGNKDIQEIADRLARASKGLEKLNKDDEKYLAEKMNEVNTLYNIGQRMRELETGQIRTRDVAYRELTELGRKYGLDAERPENYANIIAYVAGLIFAGLAGGLGSALGNKFLPRRDIDLGKVSRQYLEHKVGKEIKGKKSGAGDLEDKVITGLIILSPIFLMPFFFKVTGFAIAENFFIKSSLLANSFLFVWLFLLFFVVSRKIYKNRKV